MPGRSFRVPLRGSIERRVPGARGGRLPVRAACTAHARTASTPTAFVPTPARRAAEACKRASPPRRTGGRPGGNNFFKRADDPDVREMKTMKSMKHRRTPEATTDRAAASPFRRAARAALVSALALFLVCAAPARRSTAQRKSPPRPVERQPVERQTPGQLKSIQSAPYTIFYYKSGGLNIEAYLYRPQGAGPFPLVIYNHGSRAGQERVEKPFKFIADILVPQGYT
ncbi:MAG: hypothetical protein M3379_17700, partial [Acidobacteriota bacterium]|nr:hypothetical protein [Acidobacteriota bacterium]